MRSGVLLLAATVASGALVSSVGVTAQESRDGTATQRPAWLPAEVAEGAAQQLAERMRLLPALFDGQEPDPERLVAGARQMIAAMTDVITAWGTDGTLQRSPDLTALEIESAGDAYLDAMAHYQVCNILLYLQLQDPAYSEDLNARLTSVLGLSGVTLTVVSLREPFVAAGGDPAVIETHLSGPTLEPALEALQTDDGVRSQAEAECQPVVLALLEEPLKALGR